MVWLIVSHTPKCTVVIMYAYERCLLILALYLISIVNSTALLVVYDMLKGSKLQCQMSQFLRL